MFQIKDTSQYTTDHVYFISEECKGQQPTNCESWKKKIKIGNEKWKIEDHHQISVTCKGRAFN